MPKWFSLGCPNTQDSIMNSRRRWMWIRNNISRQQTLRNIDCASQWGWVRVHGRYTCSASRIVRPQVSAKQISAAFLRHSFFYGIKQPNQNHHIKWESLIGFSDWQTSTLSVFDLFQFLAINMSVCIVLVPEDFRLPRSVLTLVDAIGVCCYIYHPLLVHYTFPAPY